MEDPAIIGSEYREDLSREEKQLYDQVYRIALQSYPGGMRGVEQEVMNLIASDISLGAKMAHFPKTIPIMQRAMEDADPESIDRLLRENK